MEGLCYNRDIDVRTSKGIFWRGPLIQWGEGCHLEPDQRYGRAFLEATRHALGVLDKNAAPKGVASHP